MREAMGTNLQGKRMRGFWFLAREPRLVGKELEGSSLDCWEGFDDVASIIDVLYFIGDRGCVDERALIAILLGLFPSSDGRFVIDSLDVVLPRLAEVLVDEEACHGSPPIT